MWVYVHPVGGTRSAPLGFYKIASKFAYEHYSRESMIKYKCSIIRTEQNTTNRDKIQHDEIQTRQNTKKNKIQIAKIQM